MSTAWRDVLLIKYPSRVVTFRNGRKSTEVSEVQFDKNEARTRVTLSRPERLRDTRDLQPLRQFFGTAFRLATVSGVKSTQIRLGHSHKNQDGRVLV